MIGYARVSMSDQDNRRQIDDLTKFGVDLRDIYQDKASGRDMKRPGWQACWKDLREGDVLVVHAIDRLGRDLVEVVRTVKELHERGCDIKVLSMDLDTRTPTGRLIFAIVAAMAQWERELIVERTRHGLAAARARGLVGGQKKVVSDKQVRTAMRQIEGGTLLKEAATALGISRQALDKRVKQLREQDRGSEAIKGQTDLEDFTGRPSAKPKRKAQP
jgi:DNA invertase Pin-like site-specific DNA recombinase